MTPTEDPDTPRDLTDEEKRRVLPGLMRLNRYFLRATEAGMLVAQTASDRSLLEAIQNEIKLPSAPPGDEDLVLLTDAETLAVADRALVRLNLFRQAYERSMIVAHDAAQQEVLSVFAAEWGDAHER